MEIHFCETHIDKGELNHLKADKISQPVLNSLMKPQTRLQISCTDTEEEAGLPNSISMCFVIPLLFRFI